MVLEVSEVLLLQQIAQSSNLIGWYTCNSHMAWVMRLVILYFSPPAKGTMKPDSAGLVAGMASKAAKLKHGMGADDHPVVVIEFDTGYVDLYSSQSLSPSRLVSQPFIAGIDLPLAPPTAWLTSLLHLPSSFSSCTRYLILKFIYTLYPAAMFLYAHTKTPP